MINRSIAKGLIIGGITSFLAAIVTALMTLSRIYKLTGDGLGCDNNCETILHKAQTIVRLDMGVIIISIILVVVGIIIISTSKEYRPIK